ncbi:NADPH adrenodoxin oxidoreductase [Ceratobasidium sp. AG-Ba]|nr:NADPH adrenodoxin oxidoreductase [Ceratobasidium sp. AG-Ba]
MAAPFKLAIIGGGPSAFYAASRVLSKLPKDLKNAHVHVYDRLWTPHGLVRYGVAPDHPEVKVSTAHLVNCTNKFDVTALDLRFRFFGNVEIVPPEPTPMQTRTSATSRPLHLPLRSLAKHYTHLLLAYGSSTPVVPALSPDSLQPISALDFVHWYTAHPNPHTKTGIPIDRLVNAKHITVVGHGNVALDVARIILSSPSRLAPYDVPQSVLEVLNQLQIQHVSIVGRRAPAQVSFTAKEVREMMNLEGVGMRPIDPALFSLGAEGLSRQQSRLIDLMRKGSSTLASSAARTWSLDFLRSPLSISSSSVTYSINSLSPSLSAVPTSETVTIPTDLVIASVGYRSTPIHSAWYDTRLGRVRNVDGQVVREDGSIVRGVYASGWAANGARGVLASTMWNAYAVAEKIVEDATASVIPDQKSIKDTHTEDDITLAGEPGLPEAVSEASNVVVTYPEWKRIDAEEVRRGGEAWKERERMSWVEVADFLDKP